jgi:hypothetical protein
MQGPTIVKSFLLLKLDLSPQPRIKKHFWGPNRALKAFFQISILFCCNFNTDYDSNTQIEI